MHSHLGYILMIIAILHEILALYLHRKTVKNILQAGLVNTINPPHLKRDAAFWSLMFGISLFLIGWVIQWIYNNTGTIPTFLGLGLLITCGIGAMMKPKSGFWLVLPIGFIIVGLP